MASSGSYPTLYEDLRGVPRGTNWRESVVEKLKPAGWIATEGLHVLSPEELLSVHIPVQRVTDTIEGYQRYLNLKRARAFGRWIANTREDYLRLVPVIEISVDENGDAFFTDGQHRAAGAVIVGKSLRAVVTKRTEAEARRLFASQAYAAKPSRNVAILDGDGPLEEYIQDAVTSPDHPWPEMISASPQSSSRTKMSVTTAYQLLRVYASMSLSQRHVSADDRFDVERANELAVLISAFGTKSTNPEAWTAITLRAIAITARRVFRDRAAHKKDRDRWIRHMSRFPFQRHSHVRSANDVADRLTVHWNKNLPESRKVKTA